MNLSNNDDVQLVEYEKGIGQAEEMSAHDKARLGLAKWLLGVLGAILLLSACALIFGPSDRLKESELVFEYIKTAVPPIVTLVIGFYFRSADGQ